MAIDKKLVSEKNSISGSSTNTSKTVAINKSDTELEITGELEEPSFKLTINLPNSPLKTYVFANSSELVQEIRQFIIESPETFSHTCFFLSWKGKRLNDYKELQEEGITQDCELDLVEDAYTEREARIHIIHLREILAGPFKQDPSSIGLDSGLSFLSAVTQSNEKSSNTNQTNGKFVKKPEDESLADQSLKTPFTGYEFGNPSLAKFIPDNFQRIPIKCLGSLHLSGWNPVPFERRTRGDLLYLSVTTIEGDTRHITACVKGFYINKSTNTHFDPSPHSELEKFQAHSLITLLQKISPSFQRNFKALQEYIGRFHVFETIPVNNCLPAYSWMVKPTKHTHDLSRADELYLNYGTDAVDSLRDWNDEFQTQREYPRADLKDRVLRERLLNKIQADFTDSAVKGAISVVNGNAVPFNPRDPEEEHMYVYNNIFFSKAFDTRGNFANLGGNDAAHVATGKDLEGIRKMNSIDIEGLYTLGCVVVDYKGTRIVAQTIVPGIFRRQDDSIIYGFFDNGRDEPRLCSDPQFHEILRKAAKALHIAEHSVSDAKGNTVNLYTSLETKGLMGDDGRRYLFDLYRLNPIDIEFQEKECSSKEGNDIPPYPHKLTLLRPELIEFFWENKCRAWAKEKRLNKQELEGLEKNNLTDDQAENDEFDLALNADAFTDYKQPAGEEHGAKKAVDEENVRSASKFLRDTMIPTLMVEFATFSSSPIDGASLTKAMHRRGINMRYLGVIASMASDSQDKNMEHIKHLATHEIIVRSTKRILRDLLRDVPHVAIQHCVTHFLNCLLGTSYNPKPQPTLPTDQLIGEHRRYLYFKMTPESLVQQIRDIALLHFRYQLSEDFVEKDVRKLPLLREICLRNGIQLISQVYHFTKKKSHKKDSKNKKRPTTFLPEDVLNLLPTVKQANTKCTFAEEAFEAGKLMIAQSQRETGGELLLQSLSLYEQSYGFLHPETAKCYSALAMFFYHNEELEFALEFQKKAVVSLERTCGVDSYEAVHSYLHLGLFEHAAGHTELGLCYTRHAMQYWEIIYGPFHPDGATADRAKDTQECVFGQEHVLTGESYHILAKALALAGDFKGALNAEKSAYKIFLSTLGADHLKTKETEFLLKEWTSSAVQTAKMALQNSQEKQKIVVPKTNPIQLKTPPQLNDITTVNRKKTTDKNLKP
ncbi:4474_t:CDS:10 [Ambispora gerdemannii]|uniref:4474_t:CDS:1 n=1 Tax=Ambispora gerdemannii TaxID=144530 RepID=A0A9N9BS13_9GLOM|nr:4474_t:CDS:10 [Ambispora gerdemannii]